MSDNQRQDADYVAVWTASDEWYPYYFVVPAEDRNREDKCLLSPAELEFVQEADRVFRTAQRYIEEGHKRAHSDGSKHEPGCRAEDGFPCHCLARIDGSGC